jgi:hypothetical protein
MNEHQKLEFWSSLARLYDETLALGAVAETHQKAAQALQISCEALRDSAVAREKWLVHLGEVDTNTTWYSQSHLEWARL